MRDSTARTICTTAIWASGATFMSVCVWRTGEVSGILIPIAALVFGCACGATASVWKDAEAGTAATAGERTDDVSSMDPLPNRPVSAAGRVL